MPLNSTRGAASAKAFGFTAGAAAIEVDFLVIAGGGGTQRAGGGAGGYRTSFPGGTKLKLKKALTYPVSVGAGGSDSAPNPSRKGNPSSIDTIASTGGGAINVESQAGGSGAGIPDFSAPSPYSPAPGGAGNQGGYSPPEGSPGGGSTPGSTFQNWSGGGGGAGAAGGNAPGPGGNGLANSITGTSVTRGGGGGGGQNNNTGGGAPGGSGGGGPGFTGPNGTGGADGTVNTGGGGGGGGDNTYDDSAGGSGIVVLRAPSTVTFTVAPGTNTVTTAPNGDKVATFTVSGTLSAS